MNFSNYIETREEEDAKILKKAQKFMKDAHKGQYREGGDPFFTHPEALAMILVKGGYEDTPTIVAALLHDTVEDTEVTMALVKDEFGEEVAFLVEGVTDAGKCEFEDDIPEKLERMQETHKKVLRFAEKDERINVLKTVDRIHNLTTLEALSKNKQKRIIKETKEFTKKLAAKTSKELQELFEEALTTAEKLLD